MSLPDYINRLRVSLARELLGHTRLDMERVAETSWFRSARQLRRAWGRSTRRRPAPRAAPVRASRYGRAGFRNVADFSGKIMRGYNLRGRERST